MGQLLRGSTPSTSTKMGGLLTVPTRLSCRAQLFLIRHPNFLTNFLLSVFHFFDLLAVAVQGVKEVLEYRHKHIGPNFAAFGMLSVGDYDEVVSLIDSPQRRGNFLGPIRMMPGRFPEKFLISLSDEGGGGSDMHQVLHDFMWETLSKPAFERLSQPELSGYIEELIKDLKMKVADKNPTNKDVTPLVQRMVIKYIMHSLFDVRVTESQIKKLSKLFYTGGLRENYTAHGIKAINLPNCFVRDISEDFAEIAKLIEESPSLKDYEPSAANNYVSKKEWSEVMATVMGVAALG